LILTREWAGDRNPWGIDSVALELLPSCLAIGDQLYAIDLALACRGARVHRDSNRENVKALM